MDKDVLIDMLKDYLQEDDDPNVVYDIYDRCGGNFDDAYELGFLDGRSNVASLVLSYFETEK